MLLACAILSSKATFLSRDPRSQNSAESQKIIPRMLHDRSEKSPLSNYFTEPLQPQGRRASHSARFSRQHLLSHPMDTRSARLKLPASQLLASILGRGHDAAFNFLHGKILDFSRTLK
jgi:hypothetical protein